MVSAYLCVDVYIRRRWSELSFVGLPFQVSWEYAQYMSCLFVCVRVRVRALSLHPPEEPAPWELISQVSHISG